MADQKISELTAITGANTADDDLLVIVDTSANETKKITLAELEAGIARGDMTFGDNEKAIFGAGSDLQIYHDGSNSYISDAGTGNLNIIANELAIYEGNGTDLMIGATPNGAVTLSHNALTKLATTSTGIDVTGTATMDGLTVDAAGDVLLTSSVGTNADANEIIWKTTTSNGYNLAKIKATTGTNFYDGNLVFQTQKSGFAGALADRLKIDNNGDISFYEDTGTTAKFFWDASAESLTLDNATSTYGLDITGQGNGDRGMRVKNETDGTAARSNLRIENAGGIGANLLYPATSYTGVSGWANRLILGVDGASNGITLRGAEIRLTGDDSLHNPDLVVTSAGNVGIGTSSPRSGYTLDVYEAADNGVNIQAGNASADIALSVGSAGTADKFVVQAGGNVGIGTSSPSQLLELSDTGAVYARVVSSDASGAGLKLRSGGTYDVNIIGDANTLQFQNNGSEAMRITSAGRLGLGESSPDSMLHINSDGDSGLGLTVETTTGSNENTFIAAEDSFNRFTFKDALNQTIGHIYAYGSTYTPDGYQFGDNKESIQIVASGSSSTSTISLEARNGILFSGGSSLNQQMVLDSSGNLLVGTTTASHTVEGTVLYGVDGVSITRDGDNTLLLNRLTSDGDIAQFRKDGTTVGSIGASNGDIYCGTGVTALKFNDGLDSIFPYSTVTQGNTDGTTDLGVSTARFKDLYLSGGVYVGGVTSSNYLDDYEEGTFTPVIADAASGGNEGTTGSTYGRYTKIGRLVYVEIELNNIDTTGVTGTADIHITGLPFANDAVNAFGTIKINSTNFSADSVVPQAGGGQAYLKLLENNYASNVDFLTVSELNSGTSDLQLSITYNTTS